MPRQFIWTGANDLTIGCGSLSANTGVRLRYTFHEGDRIVIGVKAVSSSCRFALGARVDARLRR
jgi:uncharacterized protein involved in copper resistance